MQTRVKRFFWRGEVMNTRLMTVREVADRLGVRPDYLTAAIRKGGLRARRYGWVWMIPPAEVKRLQKSRAKARRQ